MDDIFDSIGHEPAPYVEPLEAKKARWAAVVANGGRMTLLNLVARINEGFDHIWNNSELTPAEIVEGLGTSALSVFKSHADTVEFLVAKFPKSKDLIKFPPDWATIDYEIENGVPTGRVFIYGEPA